MNAGAWSPEQYARFQDERSRPFFDLLALVHRVPEGRIVDLGCGTGALTAVLHARMGAEETVGLDSSEAMLEKAQARPGLRFRRQAIEAFEEENAYDLVFSNAALHWVADHPALFRRLVRALRPGGQLAVQMPVNFDHPSHALALELAREEPYRSALEGYERALPLLAPDAYASLLFSLGLTEPVVRLQVYAHPLASSAEVAEWVKGALLTDYAQRLKPEMFARFFQAYRGRLLGVLGDESPYLYTFKRLFLRGKIEAAGAAVAT